MTSVLWVLHESESLLEWVVEMAERGVEVWMSLNGLDGGAESEIVALRLGFGEDWSAEVVDMLEW